MSSINIYTGSHHLGTGENANDIYALYSARGIVPRWVKFVGDAARTASAASALPAGTNLAHRWYAYQGFNSDNFDAWIGSDTPASSARRLAGLLDSELRILQSITGRKVVVDGPFNEVGHSERYGQFCFEFAKILWNEYGLLLAAFGSSTGSYNEAQAINAKGVVDGRLIRRQIIENATILSQNSDSLAIRDILRVEAQNAKAMAESFVIPMLLAGIPIYFSLHAYASLYPMVWHGLFRQFAQISQIWQSGITGDIFGLNDFMPASALDDPNGPPITFTNFGYWRLLWHFLHNHQIDLKKLHVLVLEAGIVDNVGDPGIGQTAGGWRDWSYKKGLWDRLKLSPSDSYEMVAARALWYQEQQARLLAPRLGDIGLTPFTYSDQPGSRWYDEFRVIDVMPLFFGLVTSAPDTTCRVTPAGTSNVYIRQSPALDAPVLGLLRAGEQRPALAHTDTSEGTWYRIGDSQYVAAWVTNLLGDCETIPEETGEPNIMTRTNLVLRDHKSAQIKQIVPKFGGNVFVQLGDPREAVDAATGLDFIVKIWYQVGNVTTNNFLEMETGSARRLVDDVLLQYPILKNFINDHQSGHWESGAVNEYKWVLNDKFTPEAIIEVPINGDLVPQSLLGLYFAVSALFAERLNNYIDPATTRPADRLLTGCYISRDIALDTDRNIFWTQARNSGLLNAIQVYGGYIQLRRKFTGSLSDYKRSSIWPDEDLKWLRDNGYGSIPVLLVIEWKDGHEQWVDVATAAKNLWLIDDTTRKTTGLDTAIMLRQVAETGDWGDGHDLRDVEAAYINYRDGLPPNIAWLPEDVPPPPDTGGGCGVLNLLPRSLRRSIYESLRA